MKYILHPMEINMIYNRIIEIQEEVSPRSVRAFELSIGKTSGYLNMMKKNKGKPSVEVVQNIIELYSQFNLYWIILGKGEKYVNTAPDSVNEASSSYGLENEIKYCKELLKSKEETISILKHQLGIKNNINDSSKAG